MTTLDVVFLTAVVALLYRDFFLHADGLVSAVDGKYMSYPFEHYVASQLRAGELPLWLPHTNSGFPTIGYPQYGVFYPFHWLFWLWPQDGGFSPTLYGAQIVFHSWLSAMTMYALVVQLGWHRAGAVAAGLAWAIAPNALAYAGWANAMPGFAWWPLTVLFLVRAEQRGLRNWGDISLAGLCLGMTILAQPAQPAIQLIVLICLLFVFHTQWAGWTWRSLAPRGLRYGSVGLIGIGLAAVSLLPVVEYASASVRFLGLFGAAGTLQRMGLRPFTYYHFGIWQLPGFVIYNLSREESAFFAYIGAFMFCAAALGCAAAYRSRNRFALCLIFLLVVSILYMFDVGLPYLFYWLPLLNMIREPAYYASYVLFAASLLAAYGIDQVVRRQISRADALRTAGAAIACLAALSGLAWAIEGSSMLDSNGAVFLGVAAAWMLCFSLIRGTFAANALATIFCGLVAWNFLSISNPVALNVASMAKLGFAESLAGSRPLERLAPPGDDPQRVMYFRSGEPPTGPVWNPSIAALAGFYDVFGYNNPVLKAPFQAFLKAREFEQMLVLLDVRTIATDPSGVSAVAANYGLDPAAASVLESIPMDDATYTPFRSDVFLFRYGKGMGHAWLTTRYEVVKPAPASRGVALELLPEFRRLLKPGFDLSSTVILDRAPDGATAAVDPAGPPASGQVSWLRYRPNRMELQVTSDRPAILTVSELSYPGWRARVNGEDVPVYKADGLLRAVVVPAGTSKVDFHYMPNSLLIGCLISVVAAGGAVMLLVFSLMGRRSARARASLPPTQ
ncbi:YfhO family protein [Limobrevibacterium gyesilva]|uniref:YfhO family protein n=1 Tax=Limobrevibacterium gyesilva TaxID=2991712 RepID=A0AA41YMG4_9PROT|nr:YfhO family protein [Limobrevibacterium gyesilva]MCW3472975.1 YfhO family protein [Limobrevibacterium gyesilva]